MLYRIASDDTTTAIPKISGRNIAHVHRTVAERALLGADLHLDHVELISASVQFWAQPSLPKPLPTTSFALLRLTGSRWRARSARQLFGTP